MAVARSYEDCLDGWSDGMEADQILRACIADLNVTERQVRQRHGDNDDLAAKLRVVAFALRRLDPMALDRAAAAESVEMEHYPRRGRATA